MRLLESAVSEEVAKLLNTEFSLKAGNLPVITPLSTDYVFCHCLS